MNNFFWDFEYKWNFPKIDTLFPNRYFSLRNRTVSNDVLDDEFLHLLDNAGLYVHETKAVYTPANTNIKSIKYGQITNDTNLQPSSRIDIVVQGADTSNLIWWNSNEENFLEELDANGGKILKTKNQNNFTKKLSHSFSSALINNGLWTSIETTTEDRIWLRVYFRQKKNKELVSFFDAKSLLQRVL